MEHRESGRHLAAILFTDIVGYTAMMQRDEALALASVRRHHEVLEKQVPAHEGEIYQYYGDGSLNIFHSTIQAVKAAYEIQKELLKEPMVPLRIGIHIGEMYTEEGKIFGDGVNIASRIESIGQAGTVLFSKDVFEKVRNYKDFQIQKVGKFEFKNVEEPVDVYGLSNPEIRAIDRKTIEGKLKEGDKRKRSKWPLAFVAVLLLAIFYFGFIHSNANTSPQAAYDVKQSIAVLPFTNFSEGKEEDFLSLGIAEDILSQLARIPGLKVISRSSSMRFKDSNESISEIARDLKVNNILNGSIRKYDDMLRVSVRLTSGKDENVIWADDFDRKFEDVLNLQRDIALMVSEKLQVALTPQVEHRFKEKVFVDPEAYINYQKGQDILLRSSGTRDDIENALSFFDRSIAIDSNFAKAWVGVSDALSEGVFWHRMDSEFAMVRAREAANRALKIDSLLGEAYGALGSIEYIDRNFILSEKHLRKAIELSPSSPWAYERLGWIMIIRRKVDDAITMFEKAIELDPLSTRFMGSIGNALGVLNQIERGIEQTGKYLAKHPNDNYLLWTMGFLEARRGNYEKAITYLNQRTIGTKTNWILGYAYAKSGQREKAEEILNNNLEKKKTDIVPDFMIAVQYCGLNNSQKTLEYLSPGYYSKGESFFLIDLENDPFFECVRETPEFKNIAEKARTEFFIGDK